MGPRRGTETKLGVETSAVPEGGGKGTQEWNAILWGHEQQRRTQTLGVVWAVDGDGRGRGAVWGVRAGLELGFVAGPKLLLKHWQCVIVSRTAHLGVLLVCLPGCNC